MLAIGAGSAAFVTALFGRNVAFLANAVSFLRRRSSSREPASMPTAE